MPPQVLCIHESKIPVNQLKNANKGDYGDEEKLSKYTLCFFRKSGFFNEQDETVPSILKTKVEESDPDYNQLMEKIDECSAKTGETPENKSLVIYKCFVEKDLYPKVI